MTDLTFTVEFDDGNDGSSGRFVAHMEGRGTMAGEVTFVRRSPNVIIANHTGVPTDLRGRGIAGKVVKFMADHARANGYQIVPACPYIPVWLKRNPDYADVFTD